MIRHCIDFTGYEEFDLDFFRYRMQYIEAEYNGKPFAVLTHKQLADIMSKYTDRMALYLSGDTHKTTIIGYSVIAVEEGTL